MSLDEKVEQGLLPETKPEMTDVGLGPWSVSKLKTLQKCPLQFYLRYIVKLKLPEPELDEDRLLTHYGSAAHEVLDYVMQGLSVDSAFERVRVESKKYLPAEYWPEVESNRFSIEKFKERIDEFKIRNKVAKILPEKKLAVTKDWKPTQFFAKDAFFRGVIDLAIIMQNKDVLLIDHKRGPDPQWGLRNYEFQLDSYFPLFHYGMQPIAGGQSGVHFINHGEILLREYTDLERIQEKIPKEIAFYTEAAVDAVIEAGKFEYKRGTMCKYCDYKELCKGGKRGTSGELAPYESASAQLIKVTEI